MIQPITLGGFKSESFSFRNSSSAAAIPAEIDKNANLLNSVKKDDKIVFLLIFKTVLQLDIRLIVYTGIMVMRLRH